MAVQPSSSRERGLGRVTRIYLKLLTVGLLGMVPFCGFLISAGLHQRSLSRPLAGGNLATGRVVGYRYGGKGTWIPTISFTTISGSEVRFIAADTSDRPSLDSAVEVSYRAADPLHARDISTPGNTGVEVIVLAAFLGVACGIGGLLCAKAWWRGDFAGGRVSPTP